MPVTTSGAATVGIVGVRTPPKIQVGVSDTPKRTGMQDRNMRHQIAGVEYAGLENTAPTWNEKSREHR